MLLILLFKCLVLIWINRNVDWFCYFDWLVCLQFFIRLSNLVAIPLLIVFAILYWDTPFIKSERFRPLIYSSIPLRMA